MDECGIIGTAGFVQLGAAECVLRAVQASRLGNKLELLAGVTCLLLLLEEHVLVNEAAVFVLVRETGLLLAQE